MNQQDRTVYPTAARLVGRTSPAIHRIGSGAEEESFDEYPAIPGCIPYRFTGGVDLPTRMESEPMPRKKPTWREKLADDKGYPQTIQLSAEQSKRWGGGTMVIPAPREVDAIMRTVRKGRLISINEIRRQLAALHGANSACPITTGIFAWIAAHAADEAEQEGKRRVTPYWRTLKAKGELNPKYPGGIERLRTRLEAEGHVVVQRGKRFYVDGFQEST